MSGMAIEEAAEYLLSAQRGRGGYAWALRKADGVADDYAPRRT
jgi:hypothetical protein